MLTSCSSKLRLGDTYAVRLYHLGAVLGIAPLLLLVIPHIHLEVVQT